MQHDTGGILVVDKPAGISSAQVVRRVKTLFKARKAGHAGTLDPFATGVLVCCLNRATRLAQFILRGTKSYTGLLHLGITTDTQDVTGKIIATGDTAKIAEEDLYTAFNQFEGTIQQRPPIYSALKHKGVPLYRLARRGQPVQKEARTVVIERLHIKDIKWPMVAFDVTCSAGTYVRTLCDDIGRALGCGGYLKDLRRTACGTYSLKHAVTLEHLESAADSSQLAQYVLPMAEALPEITAIRADSDLAHKIAHGVPLRPDELGPEDSQPPRGLVQIISPDNHLLAILDCPDDGQNCHYCCVFN